MIFRIKLTKRALAEAIADKLRYLYVRGMDYAVGIDYDGDVAHCHEGGRRLGAVLVQQAGDPDSYGGGDMGPEEVKGVADAFAESWLDDFNQKNHAGDTLEWLDTDAIFKRLVETVEADLIFEAEDLCEDLLKDFEDGAPQPADWDSRRRASMQARVFYEIWLLGKTAADLTEMS
jgi:hypothetical protein